VTTSLWVSPLGLRAVGWVLVAVAVAVAGFTAPIATVGRWVDGVGSLMTDFESGDEVK